MNMLMRKGKVTHPGKSAPLGALETFMHTPMHPEKTLRTCVQRGSSMQARLAVHTHVFTSEVKAFLLRP